MNWNAFLATIGHGVYVWSSFFLCFALMAAEVFRLRRRIRSVRVVDRAAASAAGKAPGRRRTKDSGVPPPGTGDDR